MKHKYWLLLVPLFLLGADVYAQNKNQMGIIYTPFLFHKPYNYASSNYYYSDSKDISILNIGLFYQRQVSKKFDLRLSIQALVRQLKDSCYWEYIDTGSPFDNLISYCNPRYSYHQTDRYVQIPINVLFKIIDKKAFNLYTSAGSKLIVNAKNSYRLFDKITQQSLDAPNQTPRQKPYFEYSLAMGAKYIYKSKFHIGIESFVNFDNIRFEEAYYGCSVVTGYSF